MAHLSGGGNTKAALARRLRELAYTCTILGRRAVPAVPKSRGGAGRAHARSITRCGAAGKGPRHRAIGSKLARPGVSPLEPHQEALPPGPPPRAAPLGPFTSQVGREGGDRGEVCLDHGRGNPRRDHPPPVQPAKQMDCKGCAFAGRSRRAAPSWWVSGRSPDLACFARLPWGASSRISHRPGADSEPGIVSSSAWWGTA